MSWSTRTARVLLRISILVLALLGQAHGAELGIASVFYDRHVACPPYHIDPYKVLGIAHKTLPCGTMIEVTNRLNGKKAIVPVVDKGPCTTDYCRRTAPQRVLKRIGDMLPALAKKIGSDGLTPVELAVVK